MVLIPEVPMLNQEQIGTGQECTFAVATEYRGWVVSSQS